MSNSDIKTMLMSTFGISDVEASVFEKHFNTVADSLLELLSDPELNGRVHFGTVVGIHGTLLGGVASQAVNRNEGKLRYLHGIFKSSFFNAATTSEQLMGDESV